MTAVAKCAYCGAPWHFGAPRLCIGFALLGVDYMETLCANVLNAGFEEMMLDRQVLVWEGEGGR